MAIFALRQAGPETTRQRIRTILLHISLMAVMSFSAARIRAQSLPTPLDPTRGTTLRQQGAHPVLKEEYIWTSGDVTASRPDRSRFPWNAVDRRTNPHYFRAHFSLSSIPHFGTLYLAGPRSARVFLNGTPIGQFSTSTDQPINFRVFHADVSTAFRVGDNVLAIEAVRGRGVVAGSSPDSTQQLAYGEVLAVKILAASFGNESGEPLLISNKEWRSNADAATDGWWSGSFDDSAWPHVESLGPIESDIDFFQWSADAGMYGWPGYHGMSPWLRTLQLNATEVGHVYLGRGDFSDTRSLTNAGMSAPFTVTMPSPPPTDAEAPSLLLDFGREIAGRIVFESSSSQASVVSIAYGESDLEALATGITSEQRGGNYLGTNLVDIPPNGIARGPKSAFRYVRIRFLRGAPITQFRSIHAEAIVYPVQFEGTFESSDPELDRIWETAAYTVHLCMQDNIWDAPKRDRGRWAGDLDVEGRVILTAFGDATLLEDTLHRIGDGTPSGQPVNGIAGYTAQWITTLATLYEHSGDRTFIASEHESILRLLKTMDSDLDPSTNLLKPSARGWGFVDWAPGLYGDTPETQIGTTLEFLRAYQDAPALLRAIGDDSHAEFYEERAVALREACRKALLSPSSPTVGSTWQLNALGVLTQLFNSDDTAVWDEVFAHVKQDAPADQVISPYFNLYLLDAMAQTGHKQQALNWLRTYWGGMLAEGATSFWESYDLRWPKTNFHLSLQADGTSGYFVSLAHGWSSGPAAWIVENVLGVEPAAPGYSAVDIRPSLSGLGFARGTIPTPHGLIKLEIDATDGVTLDLPKGVESAHVYLPRKNGGEAEPITLTHSGHYHFGPSKALR
jgi:alpha-L-rhamnosidase